LNALLSSAPHIITVERAELEKLLGEQALGLSGTVAPETAAKVSHLTGAKVLVTGRVFRVEKELTIVAKVIGVETSRVYGEVVQGSPGASINDLSAELTKKIMHVVAEKGDTLVAQVETREQKVKKIISSLKPGKRPAVSVQIAERHFGTPVIDPAAETEFSLILADAGFTVVDAKSNQKPDIEISGEAFSALGMRKGDLISCRSRVEIKAAWHDSGRIVAQDRQTSVGVDIAEQTSAKTALQDAAAELAARVLPLLLN
jgi:hypothetical protein